MTVVKHASTSFTPLWKGLTPWIVYVGLYHAMFVQLRTG